MDETQGFPPIWKQLSKTCTLTFHDEAFSKHEVLLNQSLFQSWKLTNGTPLQFSTTVTHSRRSSNLSLEGKIIKSTKTRSNDVVLVFRYREAPPDVLSKYPNLEISVSENIATSLSLVKRSLVEISQIGEDECQASHVEITFRDAYLTRADMWRLATSELAGRALYKGQKITFLNSIRAQVKSIYHDGNKLTSGFFSASTKPIFRSDSARYVIFLQMSKEMWDFEPEGSGEIMFNKVIDGFLPELFKRWSDNGARHLISMVLFTRMEYPTKEQILAEHSKDKLHETPPYRDFYRVLTSNMESGHHETVLLQLKQDFKTFLMDVSLRPAPESKTSPIFFGDQSSQTATGIETIQGRPAPAIRGNILEAINTASSQFSEDYIDRDLLRTGLSIVVVTPGAGVFEVDAGLLNLTTDLLIENGVGIDLVCLARMPLHSVPLFKYRKALQHANVAETSTSHLAQRSGLEIPDKDDAFKPVNTVRLVSSASGDVGNTQDTTEMWNYAIPHWLDVSFWTPKSAVYNGHNEGIRNFAPSKTKEFLTRVKMYEVQMMGIMENETNNVSIPYLRPYHASVFGKHTNSEQEAHKSISNNGSLRSGSYISGSYETRRLASISVSPSPRSPSNINSAKILNSFGRYMEAYDENTFKAHESPSRMVRGQIRPLPTRAHTVQNAALDSAKKQPKVSDIGSTGSNLPKKPPLLGTIPSRSTTSVITRKTSNTSLINKPASILGSIKGNRPSGMAFKGFGGLAAKARAQIELSSETAHRESLLSHAMKSLPSPATLAPPKTVPTLTTSHGDLSPRTSTDDERFSSHPTSPASKPIDIRQTRHEKNTSQESNSLISDLGANQTLKATDYLSSSTEINLTKIPGKRSNLMRAFAPWFTVLNPSNPDLNAVDPSSRLGRWHHVFPRPLHASNIKWKSLCAPASIPLTTEGFPSADEFASEYDTNTWSVSESTSSLAEPEYRSEYWLLKELICARFSRGYQVVVGDHIAEVVKDEKLRKLDTFNDEQMLAKDSPLYMSRGVQIQRLTAKDNGLVEIKQFTRIRGQGSGDLAKDRDLVYSPHIKTALSPKYDQRKIIISRHQEAYDWRRLDTFIAGHEQEKEVDMPDELKYWRARYVLIPMQPSLNVKKMSSLSPEDNDEEIRLEGLYRLTQMWQKSRYTPIKEPHQRVVKRTSADTNPLDIIFRTKPPSVVVALELHDSLLEKDTGDGLPRNLLPESELLNRQAIDLKLLAQLLQSEKGIKMQNRRWHLRMHDYCFIGLEFVTWLVDNFRDIDNREAAVEFGEQLMKEGLFIHVEKRHNFRDGNFFYQIGPDYQQHKTTSWLSKFASVPSTPIAETRNSPRMRPHSSEEDTASEDGAKTPTEKTHTRKVVLSKRLVYDIDRKRKSHKKEIINLHYDRISSADDCYHIRINWLNVTPRLVEDAVSSWASAVERYGLRLVEIPISEASLISELHAFRSPYLVKLAKQPPEPPLSSINDVTTFSARPTTIRFPYHRALLKKFNFVLDLEAAEDFPQSVDVSYSWGKPDYQHPQFISRDGILLAQINEDGNFLLVANRLATNRRGTQGISFSRAHPIGLPEHNNHHNHHHKSHKPQSAIPSSTAMPVHNKAPNNPNATHFPAPRVSPFPSPSVRATPDVGLNLGSRTDIYTPAKIRAELEKFCHDANQLERFYEEVGNERGAMILVVPTLPNTPSMGPIGESHGEGAGGGRGHTPLPPVPTLKDFGLSSTGTGAAKK